MWVTSNCTGSHINLQVFTLWHKPSQTPEQSEMRWWFGSCLQIRSTLKIQTPPHVQYVIAKSFLTVWSKDTTGLFFYSQMFKEQLSLKPWRCAVKAAPPLLPHPRNNPTSLTSTPNDGVGQRRRLRHCYSPTDVSSRRADRCAPWSSKADVFCFHIPAANVARGADFR